MPASVEKTYAKTIGEAIKAARERRRLTQVGLGRAVKNSKNTVSNWERGVSAPTVENLRELCLALGVEPQQLLAMPRAAELEDRGAGEATGLVSQLASLRKAAEKAESDLMKAFLEAEEKARRFTEQQARRHRGTREHGIAASKATT